MRLFVELYVFKLNIDYQFNMSKSSKYKHLIFSIISRKLGMSLVGISIIVFAVFTIFMIGYFSQSPSPYKLGVQKESYKIVFLQDNMIFIGKVVSETEKEIILTEAFYYQNSEVQETSKKKNINKDVIADGIINLTEKSYPCDGDMTINKELLKYSMEIDKSSSILSELMEVKGMAKE